MAVLCGWASQSEYKSVTGVAGDQPGWEVKTGNWYYFGQNVVLRFKSRTEAAKAARICEALCRNKHVGYDQNQRTTLFSEMRRVGWDPAKITKNCETDCSAMIAVILNAIGIRVSKDIYTGNMVKAIMDTGKFSKFTGATYCKQDKYCRYGDIIVNESSHVIMALQDGAGTKELDRTKPATTTSSTKTDRVKKGQRGLNSMLGAELVIDGSRGPQTRKCEIMAVQYGANKQFRTGLAVDGLFGRATRSAMANKYIVKGSHGMYVRAIQCILYTHGYDPNGIDSSFGAGMDKCVRKYQKDHGLSVDGSVGYKTLLSLIG